MSDTGPEIEKKALTTRYADLLVAQADVEELQLIDDLETLYTSARVPVQLSFEQAFPNGMHRQERSVAPETTPASPPKRHAAAVRRRRWINRLNAIAAVLIAVMLVSSLLVVTRLAQRSRQGNGSDLTNVSQCVIPQARKSAAWLSILHMINVTTGWALGTGPTTGHNPILRTTDGGTTWQDVTPLQLNDSASQFNYASDAYFLNACSAWIVQTEPHDAAALLLRTNDGGLTWRQSALPGNQIRGIDFIDASVGWLTVDVLKNSKFAEEDFYHTMDGGQHWTKIAVSSPGADNQPGALPFANADNNLTFLNAITGWATGSSMMFGPRLFVTHDGGRTWHQQVLPSPDGDSRIFKSGTVVWPPQFFSASDGILPVSFWAANGLDVYVTHNGGNSWQSTSLLRIPMPPNLDVSAPTGDPIFVDADHGWVSGWQGTPLYATSDGGQHWTKIVPKLNLGYWALRDYDFVTDKVGWAPGGFTGKSPGPVPPVLFKTEDSGKTWKYIQRG